MDITLSFVLVYFFEIARNTAFFSRQVISDTKQVILNSQFWSIKFERNYHNARMNWFGEYGFFSIAVIWMYKLHWLLECGGICRFDAPPWVYAYGNRTLLQARALWFMVKATVSERAYINRRSLLYCLICESSISMGWQRRSITNNASS